MEIRAYAASHWARKLVFASFPVGNIVPLKSEVIFPSKKLGVLRAPRLSTRKYELGNTSFRAQWKTTLVMGLMMSGFVLIDTKNVRTKLEVRSFTRS